MLNREEIVSWFALDSNFDEKIGFELEMWVLDQESGNQLPYGGERGMRELLLILHRESLGIEGWTLLEDEGVLTGLNHPNHGSLTLEPGCALEYSSLAHPSCTTALEDFHATIEKIRPVIQSFGAFLVLLGSAPFGINERCDWLPKSRIKAQGDYFQHQADGHSGHLVMSQICSLQICLDLNSEDFSDKVRASSIISPLLAALSANSCLDNGKITNFAARRQLIWLEADSLRTGTPPTLFSEPQEPFELNEYIEWLLDMPMMFYVRDGLYHELPRKSFRAWLSTPFPDGTLPTITDWKTHVSSVFPDVRVRQYLEFRVMDAPHPSLLGPLIILFTSLIYDPIARDYILNNIPHTSHSERSSLYKEIALKGVYAKLGQETILDISTLLLEQGRQALLRRISLQIESESLLGKLDSFISLVEQEKYQKHSLYSLQDNLDQSAWKNSDRALQIRDIVKFGSL